MNKFVFGLIGLTIFLVVLMVFMPIANLLISEMIPYFGVTTIAAIAVIPIVLITCAIYVFVLQDPSTERLK